MQALLAWVSRVNRGMAVWSGLATGIMMLAIVADVVSRSLFGKAIQGASELAVVMLITLVFFGLGGAQAEKANFSVDIVTRLLPVRLAHVFAAVALGLSAIAIGLLAYYSWGKAVAAYVEGEADYGVIPFPIWPSRFLIAFGWGALMLQLVLEALASACRTLGRSER